MPVSAAAMIARAALKASWVSTNGVGARLKTNAILSSKFSGAILNFKAYKFAANIRNTRNENTSFREISIRNVM